ncbi:hypothetical protein EUGRSUZ_C02273 [Eucalyptus grandis]|uniref:Uncharacterized protein n=2 Tax=Eucalyptus grandis TaxID=71139 RepID=A0ACC3LFM9_EUCGR|nr:hypothetical protein EUGRSUZ_C02273 [Eucalyptus grandis]
MDEEETETAPRVALFLAVFQEKVSESWNGIKKEEIFLEMRRPLLLAGILVLVNPIIHCLQVISAMFVGHLRELALLGAYTATSLASMTSFSCCSYGAKQCCSLGIHMQRAMIVLLSASILSTILLANADQILLFFKQDPNLLAEVETDARFMIPSIFVCALLQCHAKFLQMQNNGIPMMISSNLPSCKRTWTGSSKEASHGIPGFLKLAIPSAVMLCLQSWSFEMMVLLSGLLPNTKLETSLLSIRYICTTQFFILNTGCFVYMMPFGLSGSINTRISNELSAGRPQALFGLTMGTLMILGRRAWGYLYSTEEEEKVVKYVGDLLVLIACSHCFDGVQSVGTLINLGANYLVGIPFAVFQAFACHLGGKGLWSRIIAAKLVQALSLAIVTLCTNWEKK